MINLFKALNEMYLTNGKFENRRTVALLSASTPERVGNPFSD